jgi:hypothetical protein
VRKIDIDISRVPDDPEAPNIAIRAIIVILVTMALLAIYSNVQKWRRDKLETAIVTPVATPSPSPGAR